jgi:hypothetical protein
MTNLERRKQAAAHDFRTRPRSKYFDAQSRIAALSQYYGEVLDNSELNEMAKESPELLKPTTICDPNNHYDEWHPDAYIRQNIRHEIYDYLDKQFNGR